MPPYQPEDTEFIKSLDADAPKFSVHGTDQDIRDKLRTAKTWNWKLNGTELSCETELGPLVQQIPPNYICEGTGPDGKPVEPSMLGLGAPTPAQ